MRNKIFEKNIIDFIFLKNIICDIFVMKKYIQFYYIECYNMKKLLIVSLVLVSSTMSASWYLGRQCGNGQDSNEIFSNPLYDDAQVRLSNLEALRKNYEEEDSLEQEDVLQVFIDQEKSFVQSVKILDPLTPYEVFIEDMDSLRFACDELLSFKKNRLYLLEESSRKMCNSGQYQAVLLSIQKDFKKLDRIKQLKELNKSYQDLQEQVDEYDKKLKDSTIVTFPIYTCDSYTQYQSKWKTRSQQHVIPLNNNQANVFILNILKDLYLKNKDQRISIYKEKIVDVTTRTIKEKLLELQEDRISLFDFFNASLS